MALIRTNLVNEIRAIIDLEYTAHAGFPGSTAETAARWATAVNNYASLVTPPSVTSAAAYAAFQNTLLGMDANSGNGVAIFTSAFTAYAAALAPGMAPAFAATPPPIPIQLGTIIPSLGVGGATAQAIAESMATIIDTWFRTGIAVNNTSGATIPWS